MTDYHIDELKEARGLLSETAGWLTAWALHASDPALASALRARRDKIADFLTRPIFQDQEAA